MRVSALFLISTSGLKSDVTVVFLDPTLLRDARIPAICEHLRQKLVCLGYACVDFQDRLPKMAVLGTK